MGEVLLTIDSAPGIGIATYVADLNANNTTVSDVIAFSSTVGGSGNGDPDEPGSRSPASAIVIWSADI